MHILGGERGCVWAGKSQHSVKMDICGVICFWKWIECGYLINFATNGNPITSDFCPDFGHWYLDIRRSGEIHPQKYFFG